MSYQVLARKYRPRTFDELVGQEHVSRALMHALDQDRLHHAYLFTGTRGVGKTTIARLLAQETDLHFVQISAIFSGVPELRKVFEQAKIRRGNGQGTLLFVDEIHRFNKAQQDGFLPHMEDGTILLVGATTENPSFELNAALLSRAQVLILTRLSEDDLERLIARAEADPENAEAWLREALSRAPCHPDALLGMAHNAATQDEVTWLRRAEEAGPLSSRVRQALRRRGLGSR